jgi:hypothetical protein
MVHLASRKETGMKWSDYSRQDQQRLAHTIAVHLNMNGFSRVKRHHVMSVIDAGPGTITVSDEAREWVLEVQRILAENGIEVS